VRLRLWKKSEKVRKKRGNVPVIGDMICCLLTMPAAFSYLRDWSEDLENEYLPFWVFLTFFLMGASRLFRAFRLRKRSKVDFITNLVYGFALLACATLLFFFDDNPAVIIISGVTFWATLLSGRILSIIRNHKLRNILLNILAIFVILSYAVSFFAVPTEALISVMLVAGFQALFSIMTVTFSRIKLDVLREIIRKTYAMEIIFGLLLLMLACSSVLAFMEDGIESYTDALWYCFAVVTTIGFGDVTVSSFPGRLISVVLGVYGIIVVALITSIIVNFYGEMKKTEEEDE